MLTERVYFWYNNVNDWCCVERVMTEGRWTRWYQRMGA